MGIKLRWKKFNYMLEIDIFRNYLQSNWVSWGVIFEGFGVQMTPRCPAGWDYDEWVLAKSVVECISSLRHLQEQVHIPLSLHWQVISASKSQVIINFLRLIYPRYASNSYLKYPNTQYSLGKQSGGGGGGGGYRLGLEKKIVCFL